MGFVIDVPVKTIMKKCSKLLLLLWIPFLPWLSSLAAAEGRPNVLFIFVDDQGYYDLGCYGATEVKTPRIDRLAKEGMTFTDAHSPSAVCTPTRYGVVTGRYCWRTRLKSGVLNGYSSHLIDENRETVASMLKKSGYATGMVGKWHLGLDFAKAEPGGQWPLQILWHGLE